ncbi:MAG: triple tyrosine motif-containing protein [Crocinitomicaceae bacterium]|nr:triple tyrosine motif-containing protein [Crocinitomicaceae bacterium]
MAETSDGNLWAAYDGISHVDFSKGYENQSVTTLDSLNGFTSEMQPVEVVKVGEKVLFGTQIGLYTYDHSANKLVPSSIFGKRFCDGSTPIENIAETRNGDVWITIFTGTGILRKQANNSFDYDSLPIRHVPITGVWDIYEDEDAIVWVCGTEAIVRYDPNVDFDYKTPYKSFIRSVVVNDKDEIFSGNYADENGFPITHQPKEDIPVLGYDQNSITFKFGAASYDKGRALEFSVKLEGKDAEWSTWRTSGEMSYNNLPEGRYTFKVRSKNIYGNISEEAFIRLKYLLLGIERRWLTLDSSLGEFYCSTSLLN